MNTNATLNSKLNKTGWGVVARDWQGKILGLWALPTRSCSSAKVEEAMAIRAAMQIAKQQGWKQVEFESDCKQAIDRICGEEEDVTLEVIIRDIKQLNQCFDNVVSPSLEGKTTM